MKTNIFKSGRFCLRPPCDSDCEYGRMALDSHFLLEIIFSAACFEGFVQIVSDIFIFFWKGGSELYLMGRCRNRTYARVDDILLAPFHYVHSSAYYCRYLEGILAIYVWLHRTFSGLIVSPAVITGCAMVETIMTYCEDAITVFTVSSTCVSRAQAHASLVQTNCGRWIQ